VFWCGSEQGWTRLASDGEAVAVSSAAFCAQCDVGTVHVRLTHETMGMVTAIDVFDVELITSADDTLANHPNVVVTFHIGFMTEDEFEL
tara:strand:- start:301 stop:567 length:267 start_codon:yes stop_codon:yes gene_type:complete